MRWLSVAVLAVASTALADDAQREAAKHFERATELHKQTRFAEALDEMKTAYALSPKPEFLYAIAQLHVQLGECDRAIPFYERFLTTKPKPNVAAKAREAIEICKTRPPPPKPHVDPEPVVVEKPAAPPTIEPPKPRTERFTRPWYTDTIGDVLVGAGLVGGVVAAIQYRRAVSDNTAAEAATTYPERLSLVDSARGKRTTAVVFGGVAGGLAVAGLVHYLVGSRVETRVIVAPTGGGGTVSWWRGF